MLIFVRIGLVLEGIIFLIMDLRNYVRQRLTETTAILWALVSVILIITGAVPFPEKYTYAVAFNGSVSSAVIPSV